MFLRPPLGGCPLRLEKINERKGKRKGKEKEKRTALMYKPGAKNYTNLYHSIIESYKVAHFHVVNVLFH